MQTVTLNNEIFLKGDAKSNEMLYRYFAPRMYGICLRFAGNEMEADDILQEGFIKILTKIKNFRNEGSLEGWIRRTIINTAINYYRKNQRNSRFSDIDGMEVPEANAENIFDKFSREELLKLIQELPNGYRTVFNLNIIEGYTHREIGEMLNISDNTSKSQLTRAKNILRKRILAIMKERVKVPFENMKVVKNSKPDGFEIKTEYLKAV
ncbi:MAG: sigma-70 family RNA polymerase sigma factor [Bacteroidales bacterium]